MCEVCEKCLNASVGADEKKITTRSGERERRYSYRVQYEIVRNMEDRLSSQSVRIESYAIDKQLVHVQCTLSAINSGHNRQ
jgi:hypothetical protein